MIYKFYKYRNVHEYIKDIKKSSEPVEYTILHRCNGLNITPGSTIYTDKCFGCLFCVFGSSNIMRDFLLHWGSDTISNYSSKAFKGNIIKLPSVKNGLRNPNKSLEDFTLTAETLNIQPWAAGIIHNICTTENRIGMEIPVPNLDYDRDGRLDICSKTSTNLIAIETKVSLNDALKDERFIEQHEKYTTEIKKTTENFLYLTLFGGKETDLLPGSHSFSTGKVGGKATRFYDILTSNNIKFISASALWCLACKFIALGDEYAWDTFLINTFNQENCIGLISAGKIIFNPNSTRIEIVPID